MTIYHEWATEWNVSPVALRSLMQRIGIEPDDLLPETPAQALQLEAFVQAKERLAASRQGVYVFRNNVGAFKDDTGRVIRYGLANDSKKLNKMIKSSDLIGIKSIIVTPEMVGSKVAIFWARECKRQGWVYKGTDEEKAQLAFINLVNGLGGDAAFTTGEGL
jgi:hypothetical protein